MRSTLPLFAALVFTCTTGDALAADPDATRRAPETRDLSLRLDTGVFTGLDRGSAGPVASISGFYRVGPWLVGGVVESGMNLMGRYDGDQLFPIVNDKYLALAPAGGLVLPSPSWARLELVAMLGVRHVWNVDMVQSDFDTDGASATLPFAGVRAYAGVSFGRFTMGLVPFLEADILRPEASYTGRDARIHGDSATATPLGGDQYRLTSRVGGASAGALLALGTTLPL